MKGHHAKSDIWEGRVRNEAGEMLGGMCEGARKDVAKHCQHDPSIHTQQNYFLLL